MIEMEKYEAIGIWLTIVGLFIAVGLLFSEVDTLGRQNRIYQTDIMLLEHNVEIFNTFRKDSTSSTC